MKIHTTNYINTLIKIADYRIGVELIILNRFLTFVGLWMVRSKMNLKKIIPVFFCLILSFTIRPDEKSNIFLVNKNLNKNPAFSELEKEMELEMGIDREQPKSKRTARINYMNSEDFRCRSFIDKEDLEISIYNNSGLDVGGFKMIINKGKYTIVPFSSSDNMPNTTPFKIDIKKQYLILNKKNFVIGDSIYGYIDFNINELFKNENSYLPHIGKGYFRSKISKK